MEDYLRRFTLGARTQSMAWLDCGSGSGSGSGADGLEREWEPGPEGAQERDAVPFRVAQGSRPSGKRPGRVADVGRGGLPSAAAVVGVAGRRGPLRRLRTGRG